MNIHDLPDSKRRRMIKANVLDDVEICHNNTPRPLTMDEAIRLSA